MVMNRKTLTLLLFLLLLSSSIFAVTFPYGRSGKIIYDLKTGVFDVYDGNKEIFHHGFSSVVDGGKLIRSQDYTNRSYEKLQGRNLGSGIKHIITLKGKGLPTLTQTFYTDVVNGYFLLEIEIKGKNLKSNRMVPLQGELISPVNSAEIRSLYVPFDNDTFIRYDAKIINETNQNVSAEVGALYNDASRNGFIAGSVEHENWKTGIKSVQSKSKGHTYDLEVISGYTEPSLTRDTITHGFLSGERIRSPKILIGQFADWRTGMEVYAKANLIAEPPFIEKWNKPTPIGWNSWGVMQDKISYEKATKVVDFFADSLKSFRNEGVAFIDLDSYWDKMIKGGLEGDFTELKAFADYAKKNGLKPGVYWAPFTDWGFKSGAQRRAEGSKYTFGELWTKVGKGYHDIDGARALDPTHPGTQKRIELVIGKLKACGFEMIKIDFLGHAAIESEHFYDPKITTGMQAYRVGMEYLVKQLDHKMLVYAAISPSLASARYVHVRRIACDAFKSIKDTEYTLNSLTNGWWQTYLYDYMDADHVVFASESEGANVARLLSAVITGTLIVGDDYSTTGQWNERAKKLLQNPQLLEILKDGKSFRPVEGNKEKGASEMFVKTNGKTTWMAIFNYKDSDIIYPLEMARLGFSENTSYQAEDLLNQTTEAFKKGAQIKMNAGSARIFKISTNQ
jgi:alpha-galactosidase